MLLAFGSIVAMGLPIITALAGLGVGIALLELVTHLLVVPNFSPEMAIMIGIGVGIDYALFIVTRYRQGIFEGREPRDAVVTSHMTAGRSVLFAGTTVVISLFGLYLIGQAYMIGLATACIAAVLMVLAGGPDAVAGHARVRGRRHRQAAPAEAVAKRRAAARERFLAPLEPLRAAAGLADRHRRRRHIGRPGAPDVQHATGLHGRQQRPHLPHARARPTTSWRRGSVPGSTDRSWSQRTCRGLLTSAPSTGSTARSPGTTTASLS